MMIIITMVQWTMAQFQFMCLCVCVQAERAIEKENRKESQDKNIIKRYKIGHKSDLIL